MYGYANPAKILNSIGWLKVHNPLYADVVINQEWALDAQINDSDLYASLVGINVPNGDASETINTEDVMRVATKARTEELKMQMRKSRFCFLNTQRSQCSRSSLQDLISANEAVK